MLDRCDHSSVARAVVVGMCRDAAWDEQRATQLPLDPPTDAAARSRRLRRGWAPEEGRTRAIPVGTKKNG